MLWSVATLKGIKEILAANKKEKVFNGIGVEPSSLDILPDPDYIEAALSINGLNDVNRSGDIILIMKDKTTGSASDRYTIGAACKSWHGSLNPSDSYVPLILAYPGGNKKEIEKIVEVTDYCDVAEGCDGNWNVTDLIKTIINKQYGAQ